MTDEKKIPTPHEMAGAAYPMASIGVEPDKSLYAAYANAIRAERDRNRKAGGTLR